MASCRHDGHHWPDHTVLHPTENRRMRTCTQCGTVEWWENSDPGAPYDNVRHGYVYPAGTQYALPPDVLLPGTTATIVRPASVGQHVVVRSAAEFRGRVTRIGEAYISVVPTDGYCPPAHEPGEAVLVEPHEIVATLPVDDTPAALKNWLRGEA